MEFKISVSNNSPLKVTLSHHYLQRASRIDDDINSFVDKYKETIEDYNKQKYKAESAKKFTLTAAGLGLAGIVAPYIAVYTNFIDPHNLGVSAAGVAVGIASLLTASLMTSKKAKSLYGEIKKHEETIKNYDWIEITDKDIKSLKKAIINDDSSKLESKSEEIKNRHKMYNAVQRKDRPQ